MNWDQNRTVKKAQSTLKNGPEIGQRNVVNMIGILMIPKIFGPKLETDGQNTTDLGLREKAASKKKATRSSGVNSPDNF